MMNKGLEVIEAKWLFGKARSDRSDCSSTIHRSFFGSVSRWIYESTGRIADMKLPIQYALAYPDRCLILLNGSILWTIKFNFEQRM